MCKLMKCNQYLSQGLLPPIDFLAKLLHITTSKGKNEIHLPTFYIYNMKAIDLQFHVPLSTFYIIIYFLIIPTSPLSHIDRTIDWSLSFIVTTSLRQCSVSLVMVCGFYWECNVPYSKHLSCLSCFSYNVLHTLKFLLYVPVVLST